MDKANILDDSVELTLTMGAYSLYSKNTGGEISELFTMFQNIHNKTHEPTTQDIENLAYCVYACYWSYCKRNNLEPPTYEYFVNSVDSTDIAQAFVVIAKNEYSKLEKKSLSTPKGTLISKVKDLLKRN